MKSNEKPRLKDRCKYLVILLMFFISIGLWSQSDAPNQSRNVSATQINKNEIEGTWILIKSNNSNSLVNTKIITKNSFIWYGINSQNDIVTGAGGKYTLEGDKYTEHIDFTYNGMKLFKGKKTIFKIELKDNKLIMKGMFNDNISLIEEWKRVE